MQDGERADLEQDGIFTQQHSPCKLLQMDLHGGGDDKCGTLACDIEMTSGTSQPSGCICRCDKMLS